IATASAPRRDRTNASVRTSPLTRSASRSAASAVAPRRTGAPCSPVNSVSGGSHSANAVAPRGEAASVTALASAPVSRGAARGGARAPCGPGVGGDGAHVAAGAPRRPPRRVRDGGRGEQERGPRRRGIGLLAYGVPLADAPEPAQHLGDVRAEHAAVVVALVD